jgi:hypothetical protein
MTQIKTVVAKCVEKMLLEMGTPIFEEVVHRLYTRYNCFLFDCYTKPECLKQVLREMYGDAENGITKAIEAQIEEQLVPKPVKQFLMYLKQ